MAQAQNRPDREKMEKLRRMAEQAEKTLALRADPRSWIEENLWIRTKDQQLVLLRLNAVQQDYYSRRGPRDLILKPRQLGFTTLVCALFFVEAVLQPNTVSAMVAHDADSVQRIFGIVRLFWDRLPEAEMRRIGEPRIFNRREMFWPRLNSRFYVGTAGAFTFGRGQTINNLHCSEFAFWPRSMEALAALTEAVPLDGRIVIESTANGMGNAFHDIWVEAKQLENAYATHFYTWWQDPSYRQWSPQPLGEPFEDEQSLREIQELNDDQLRWRRAKRAELRDRFLQEYPEDDVTCFLASGRCCFDTTALVREQQRIAGEPESITATHLKVEKAEAVAVAPAQLLLWQEPAPGRKYCIGADVGQGVKGGDPSAAFVLDYESAEQVAELHGLVPPDRFGRLLDALGRYYNNAKLAVEYNNHGHSTLNTLLNECGYPNLYRHVDYDDPLSKSHLPGWPTNAKTKPLMINGLAAAVAERSILIRSSALVDECFSYVVTDAGGTEAQPGKHDDRVIAAAIAWQVRKRPIVEPNIRLL